MTEEGANEELFSIIIVSIFHHFISCQGLAHGLGRQNAEGVRSIFYKAVGVRFSQ
jgi:hypothetical protein